MPKNPEDKAPAKPRATKAGKFKQTTSGLIEATIPRAADTDFEEEFGMLGSLFKNTSTRLAPEVPLADPVPQDEPQKKEKRPVGEDLGEPTNVTEDRVRQWEQDFARGVSDTEADALARSRTAAPPGGNRAAGPSGGMSMNEPFAFDGDGGYGDVPPVDPDKDARRRALAAKWSGKTLNKFQGGMFVFGYDKLLGPDEQTMELHRALRDAVVAGRANDAQKAEFLRLDDQINGFHERKREFEQQALMPAEDEAELHECLLDIFNSENVTLSPTQVVAIVMGGQLLNNMMLLMQHWWGYGKVKAG